MSHSHTKLLFHCIFSTKGRRMLLKGPVADKVNRYMAGIARNHDAHLIRAGGAPDHRHLLLELKPTTNVADIARIIRANVSKWMHENWPELGGYGWQTGYSAFSVSLSQIDRLVAYIDGQEEHHKRQNFSEELARLLELHGIETGSSSGA